MPHDDLDRFVALSKCLSGLDYNRFIELADKIEAQMHQILDKTSLSAEELDEKELYAACAKVDAFLAKLRRNGTIESALVIQAWNNGEYSVRDVHGRSWDGMRPSLYTMLKRLEDPSED